MSSDAALEKLKYPIGRFEFPDNISIAYLHQCISYLESYPDLLETKVKTLSEDQLNTPYRPGGWTIRQVIHHIPDSHVNAYIRVKLAATTNNPTIIPYNQSAWAELEDGKNMEIDASLTLLRGVHKRMVRFFKSLNEVQMMRTYYHPEDKIHMPIQAIICLYDWHSKHHLAHITEKIKKEGW